MDIVFKILMLVSGLALFLFGMDTMGDSLQRSAGSRLKVMLGKMTSNPFKGFLLGMTVTAIIQSSSATTVMVVGFVNSGTLTLTQAVGVILGAELGTAVTAWLTGLSGIGSGEELLGVLEWLKPSSWMPILALIGIILLMFAKSQKKKDIGKVLLGFAVLMTGMDMMSDSVKFLRDNDGFKSAFTMFTNPLLGVLAGTVLTAIVQSSSASVGILQSLTTTGAITYGMAIPIIMGQNIGTCITAILAALGANKNGKRAAFVHLYFNVIGAAIWGVVFVLVNHFAAPALFSDTIGMWGVATVHTGFKILSLLILFPFHRYLEKLAVVTVRGKEEKVTSMPLDDLFLRTPSVAVERANQVTVEMAGVAMGAFRESIDLLSAGYNEKLAEKIRKIEGNVDKMEDEIGSYLVRVSGQSMDEADSHQVTKLLRLIGDFERISDHAVNIVESAEEIRDKELTFTDEAKQELSVLCAAVLEILSLSEHAFAESDLESAERVEALEEQIDDLRDRIKLNHVYRVQKNLCDMEHGFVLSDILTNLERVADHCSNVAGCVVEMARHNALDMHRYNDEAKHGDSFDALYREYAQKYAL